MSAGEKRLVMWTAIITLLNTALLLVHAIVTVVTR